MRCLIDPETWANWLFTVKVYSIFFCTFAMPCVVVYFAAAWAIAYVLPWL